MSIDATERAELEQLRLAHRLSGVASWSFEIDCGDLANARMAPGSTIFESLGYERGEAPAELWSGLALAIHADDRARVFAGLQACIAGTTDQFEAEYRACHKDGSIRWKLARGVAIRDGAGRAIRIAGTSVDITRLKAAEAEARAGRELLELGMGITGYSVTEVDRRGVAPEDGIIRATGDWEHLAPRSRGPVNVVDFFKRAIVEEDLPVVLDHFFAINRGEQRGPIEFRARNLIDGSVQWRRGDSRLLLDERGAPMRFIGATIDIHKVKMAEEKARFAVDQLRLATRLSDVYLWNFELVDGDLASARITSSEAWEPLGYQSDEVPADVGAGMAAAVFAEDQPRVWAALQAAADGTTEQLEVSYRTHHKDGSLRWNLARGVALRDAAGRATRLLGTIVDVTRLKNADEEVRVAEEQARNAMQQQRLATDLSGVGVWGYEIGDDGDLATARSIFDVDGVIAGLGYGVEEFAPTLPARISAVVHPDDQARMYVAVQDCFAGVTLQFDAECRFFHKNGSVVWRLVRGIITRDASGRPRTFTGTTVDITQLKQTQEHVRVAEEQARSAMEQQRLATDLSGVAVWGFLKLEDGDLSTADSRFHFGGLLEALGYEFGDLPPSLSGRMREDFVVPEDRSRLQLAMEDCSSGKAPRVEEEIRLRHKNGSTAWWLIRGIVTRDASGRPATLMGTAVEIAQLKATQVELQRVKDRLELAVAGSRAATWDIEMPDGDLTTAHVVFNNFWTLLGHEELPPGGESVGILLEHAVSPEERIAVRAALGAFLEGSGCEWERELPTIDKDGGQRWHLTRGIATRDKAGNPTRFTGTSIDITDRKLTERELEESEERFRRIFENAAVGMILTDLDGRFVEYNTRFCEFLGYSPAELVGRSFVEFTLPEEVAEDLERQKSVTGGDTASFTRDKQYVRKDGAIVWGNITVSVIQRRADGTPVHVMGILQDITERKLTEKALQESEDRFRRIFENAAVGMILCSTDARILESNARWREFLGYAGDNVTGRSFYEFMMPEEVGEDQARLRSVLSGEVPSFSRDKRYIRKDGTIVWGNVTVSVVQRDPDGTPTRTMGILQDISERKELEVEVEVAQKRIELAMRGSDISVFDGDVPGGDLTKSTWTHFNRFEPLGYDPTTMPTDFAGITAKIIHPDDLGFVRGKVQEAIRTTSSEIYFENRVVFRDGSVHWWLNRGTFVFDATGTLTRMIGTAIDITRLKQIEAELLRAREAAEAANRAKDEFLANVSHEIRTPMNAILGMTELAIDAAPSEHQRQLLSTVRSAAKNLLTIINDLLDFSKIASGKLTLDRADFSLRAAVGDTLRALAVRAHRKGLELLCHVRANVPDALDGDAGRLRQVLMNLVGNAIKFTPQGEVAIDVMAEPSPDESVVVIFTVRDTGIGIARDKQAAIFRAFEQEDSSTTRKYGGTGLGLTISTQLASLMDGDITVQSAPGCGSTFRFTARFARSANPDAAMVSPERLANLRVLVVDDRETNRRILIEWLTSWRMQPTSAGNAAEALVALANAHAAGAPFSVVLLDARMPDMDGVALAREIRLRWEAGGPRMILLSSDDNAEFAALAKENGVLGYLLKPVQQSELLEAIWAAMNLVATVPDTAGPAGGPQGGSRPLRVLVAEDNELNVTLLQELLQQRGYVAQFARDGRTALELAMLGEFDLMLLDLHMPELDGFEVVQAIREHERGTNDHLRIIALTARSSARDRERCLAAGMDEFLAKPLEAAALWAAMERLVAEWPLVAPAARVVEPGLLDARAILRACGGKATILEKLRVVFRRTLPVQLTRVRDALAKQSFPDLRESAHQLVATVGAFSTVTAGIASTLEDAAIREDRASCKALVERLGSLCDALLDATETLSIESLAL